MGLTIIIFAPPMKRLSLSFAIFLMSLNAFCQNSVDFPGNWSMGTSYHYGFIMAHRPAVIHLQKEHTRGFEISWQKLPSAPDGWRNTYGFPWLGITYLNLDLGNPLEIGQCHGLFPTVCFPLIPKHPMSLVLRFGWGIGYIERPFNPEDNNKNLTIGSRWNCGINSALLFRIPASSRLQVLGGVNFTHYSNGASQMPNLGLNMATVQAGIQYVAGAPQQRTKVAVEPRRKEIEYSISLASGVKDIYPPGGKKYFPVNLSINTLKDFSPKSMVGIGIDMGIDESMVPRLEEQYREGFGSKSRLGIHASYGLHVGKVYGLLQVGTYLHSGLTLDGTVYNRLGFRYYPSKRLFVCFNLKSHYAKADYFEWGLGYALRK
jgi:hypothetical protein